MNKNPYYKSRSVDRIIQAMSYLNDAQEFLKRAANEIDPILCTLCPKEAVYFYGAAKACEEHVPDDIKNAKEVKKVIAKEATK